jgi:hypothetical protein
MSTTTVLEKSVIERILSVGIKRDEQKDAWGREEREEEKGEGKELHKPIAGELVF